LYGAPPKVVWLRVGNCTVPELVAVLTENEYRLLEFETALENLLIVERPAP
jgi:predicted nuclease of predicted toxin-antitoxin system